MSNKAEAEILEADFELGYTYTRTPGVIIGKFLAALQQEQLYGIRANDGSVLFPPTEYDPRSAESLDDFVPVKGEGEVTAWTWIDKPREHHQVTAPFAFALIKLDGADTPFLHRLFCTGPEVIVAGLRVKIAWSDAKRGAITDIHGFVPIDSSIAGEQP